MKNRNIKWAKLSTFCQNATCKAIFKHTNTKSNAEIKKEEEEEEMLE